MVPCSCSEGFLVLVIGFDVLGGTAGISGGIRVFFEANSHKLHTVLPWNDPEMPWLAVFVGGLWIPNLFYWA